MINEIRTLLGNRQMPKSSLGYQYVDPGYTEFPFSTSVTNLLNLLQLKPGTDNATINFLLAQYMSLVHQPDLKTLLAPFDSRITYDPFSTFWFDQISIRPAVSYAYSGSANYSLLNLQTDLPSVDTQFQNPVLREYTLQYQSASQAYVTYNGQRSLQPVTFDGTGTSNWIDLDPGFLRCRFWSSTSALIPYFSFTVSSLNHTKLDLPAIFEKIYYEHSPSLRAWAEYLNMKPALGWVNGGFSVLDRLGASLIILAAQMKNEHNII
jgi:hypothetical protein